MLGRVLPRGNRLFIGWGGRAAETAAIPRPEEDAEGVRVGIGIHSSRLIGVVGPISEEPGAQVQRPLVLRLDLLEARNSQVKAKLLVTGASGQVVRGSLGSC